MKKNARTLITLALILGVAFVSTGCFTTIAIIKRTADAVSDGVSSFETTYHFDFNFNSDDLFGTDKDDDNDDIDDDDDDDRDDIDDNDDTDHQDDDTDATSDITLPSDFDGFDDFGKDFEDTFGFNPFEDFFDDDFKDFFGDGYKYPSETTDVGRRDDFGNKA